MPIIMNRYVNTYRRVYEKDGKKHSKAPKIQRLVTPLTLQRKRRRAALKKQRIAKVLCRSICQLLPELPLIPFSDATFSTREQKKSEASEYHKLLMSRLKEQRERRSESLAKKRAERQASQASKD